MKPTNLPKTPCTNTPSGCVIWDGPAIDCINICPGDSVTDVVYALAKELCTVMDQLNISNYDLSCIAPATCMPTDFKTFIQLLITKVCNISSGSSSVIVQSEPYAVGQSYDLTTEQINNLIAQGYVLQILN